jgi:hypothetical protein
MITQSGVHIQTIGGEAGTPTAMDIAVHFGRICRFGGAVWYPLLPHSIFVGLMAYQRSGELMNLVWGFLHDAHEAVTADVPMPFKCDCLRREQIALDNRIINKFIGHRITRADFDLIKQCDKDACDIEAVAFGIPNYAHIAIAQRGAIYNNEQDRELLTRILNSGFYHNTIQPFSYGVTQFATVLGFAERCDWDLIIPAVSSWKLS